VLKTAQKHSDRSQQQITDNHTQTVMQLQLISYSYNSVLYSTFHTTDGCI